MPLLLLLLILVGIPSSGPDPAQLQAEGQKELASRMRSDIRYQHGRALAQAVANYRIGVADYLRSQDGRQPDFEALIDGGYILTWSAEEGRLTGLSPNPNDRSFRLLNDGPLPEFSYLSWGIEHPEGQGKWTENNRWIPTNISWLLKHVKGQTITPLQRRRGIEIQMAAPVELAYVFTKEMPVTFAAACKASHFAPLSTDVTATVLRGFELWVQPKGTHYGVVWTSEDGTRTSKLYEFPLDALAAKPIEGTMPEGYVQVWPVPQGTEAPTEIDADMLKDQMLITLPKNPDDGQPQHKTGAESVRTPGTY